MNISLTWLNVDEPLCVKIMLIKAKAHILYVSYIPAPWWLQQYMWYIALSFLKDTQT